MIGARGTGKTSVIEAIRFGLGVAASTPDAARRAAEHARSVLRSGQVTLSIHKESGTVTATRSADDDLPRSDGELPRAVIFAQSEIEQVGQLPSGRLRLIDGFVSRPRLLSNRMMTASLQLRSVTAELTSARTEHSRLQTALSEVPSIVDALADAERSSAALTHSSVAATVKIQELNALSQRLAEMAVRSAYLDRAKGVFQSWSGVVEGAGLVSPDLERWTAKDDDPIATLRPLFSEAEAYVTKASAIFQQLTAEVVARQATLSNARIPLEDAARKIRTEIEAVREGAGQAARRVTQLKERLAQLKALETLALEWSEKVAKLHAYRSQLFDELEAIREERFKARQGTAVTLNRRLMPRIKIKVTRAAEMSDYERVLTTAFRGSGLRYNDLTTLLVQKIAPRELLEAIEAGDFEAIAETAGIGKDRAVKLVSHLQESDLGELAVVDLEDVVDLYLLDGGDYKRLDQLSTGQRCTVVLPILLEHRDRLLILDQPEDHIDNAFIVDTIIKSLEARADNQQIIISTHNANIPVLGGANQVVHLASDGRVGFVKHAGSLDDETTIAAITGLMEGGIEAFRRRGKIYERY